MEPQQAPHMCAQHGAAKQYVCKVCNALFCPVCIRVHVEQQQHNNFAFEDIPEFVPENRGEFEDRQTALGKNIHALRMEKRGVLEAATKFENSARLHTEYEAAMKRARQIFGATMGQRRELSRKLLRRADTLERLIREYELKVNEARITKENLGEDSMQDRRKVLAENMAATGGMNLGAEEEEAKKVLAEVDNYALEIRQREDLPEELSNEFDNIRKWVTQDMESEMKLAKAVMVSSGRCMKAIYKEETQAIRSAKQTLQAHYERIKKIKESYGQMVGFLQGLDVKAKSASEALEQFKSGIRANIQIIVTKITKKMKENITRVTLEKEESKRELTELFSEIKKNHLAICKNGCKKLGCTNCGRVCDVCKTYTCMKCTRTCRKCPKQYCASCSAKLAKCEVCEKGICCHKCCKTCKKKVCMDCATKCEGCKTKSCKNCMKLCDRCKGAYCVDKCAKGLVECGECKKACCTRCVKQCEKCRRKYCVDCAIKLIKCEGCGKANCAKCTRQCKNCNRECCADCIGKCKKCKKIICVKCMNRCEKCYERFCAACSSIKLKPCVKCKKTFCKKKCPVACANCEQSYCEGCYKLAKKIATCCGSVYCELCTAQCKKCTWKIYKDNLPDIAQVTDNDLRVKFTSKVFKIAVRGDLEFKQGIHYFEVVIHQFDAACRNTGFGICDIVSYKTTPVKDSMLSLATGITTEGIYSDGAEGEICKLETGQPYLCTVNMIQQTLTITGKGVDVKAKLAAGKSYVPVLYGCHAPAEMIAKPITKFE